MINRRLKVVVAGKVSKEILSDLKQINNLVIVNRFHSDFELASLCFYSKGVIVNCRNFTTTGQLAFASAYNDRYYLGDKVLFNPKHSQMLTIKNINELVS